MKSVRTPSTVVVPAGRICPRCGAPLGGFGPEGLCGVCLFDSGLAVDPPAVELDLLTTGSRRFGDYELIEEIARGGMGVIFKALQLSLNRLVAVKMILRGEFASVADLARFRAEAETAARLQHPNIVAIHEVGEREGQPYFSMDYVEGQNLSQLVGNTPLTAVRAATYLKTVAEAVQYAHEQGVLHRDLKPSNVLIDASDQPHVTDFGLAKHMAGDTSLTLTGQVLGSPNFMPPEQATGRNEVVGPASDVYSLGAMLYHALTGRPPFVAESVTATLRLVAESEAVSPRLLVPTVPPDLETICLKCLQKEPHRRYATAQELADDLARYLRNEPIEARTATPVERTWRWCRRKPAVAGVVALLCIIGVGSPIVALRLNQARLAAEQARQNEAQLRHQAEANEKKAETEATKSQQVARFLKEMLSSVGSEVAQGRDTQLLKSILDNTVMRIGTDLKDQPEVEAELRQTLGGVYEGIDDDRAESMFREALDIRRRIFGDDHPMVEYSQAELARYLRNTGRLEEAERLLRSALSSRQKRLGSEHLDVAVLLYELGKLSFSRGKLGEAEELVGQASEVQKRLLGDEHPVLAQTLVTMALLCQKRGRPGEAEAAIRKAMAIQRKRLGNQHREVANTLMSLGVVLILQERKLEAEAAFREALEIMRSALAPNHPNLHGPLGNLGTLFYEEGRLGEAEATAREIIALDRKLEGEGTLYAVQWWYQLGRILRDEGKLPDAERALREGLEIDRKLNSARPSILAEGLKLMAQFLTSVGKPAEARPLYREIIETRLPGAERGDFASLNQVAWLLATCPDQEVRDGLRAVAYAQKAVVATGRKNAGCLDTLAAAHAESGNFGAAVSVEQEAIALFPEGKMKADLTTRLRLYESNSAYRGP